MYTISSSLCCFQLQVIVKTPTKLWWVTWTKKLCKRAFQIYGLEKIQNVLFVLFYTLHMRFILLLLPVFFIVIHCEIWLCTTTWLTVVNNSYLFTALKRAMNLSVRAVCKDDCMLKVVARQNTPAEETFV